MSCSVQGGNSILIDYEARVLKLVFYKKAAKIDEIFTVYLTLTT